MFKASGNRANLGSYYKAFLQCCICSKQMHFSLPSSSPHQLPTLSTLTYKESRCPSLKKKK